MLVKSSVDVWYKIVFIRFSQPRYSWELVVKHNCHVLNCNLQIMIFCWLILILIQLPQNSGERELMREEKVKAWYLVNISNSSRRRFYLFIILEIHFQQQKGLSIFRKGVAAWLIILFDVKGLVPWIKHWKWKLYFQSFSLHQINKFKYPLFDIYHFIFLREILVPSSCFSHKL